MRLNDICSSLLLSAVCLATIAGCGGSSSSAPSSGPSVSNYYIADTGNSRLVRFQSFASPTSYNVFPANSTTGANSSFTSPADLAFDSSGNIYTVDSALSRISMLGSDFLSNFTAYGSAGSGVGQFMNPTGIAVDSSSRIYVADTGNKRIVRMSSIAGATWEVFVPPAGVANPFVTPHGIALDSNGNIYVSDTSQNEIFKISSITESTGQFSGVVTALKTFNSIIPSFNGPTGIAIDFQNKIYVADTGNDRIVQFADITGTTEAEWDAGGVVPGGAKGFTGFTVLGRDHMLIADSANSRIYRILDITGSFPSSYGSPGSGTDQMLNPAQVKAH